MIKYALRCDGGHAFESWFRDSASYDSLAEAKLVACPQCGSSHVDKALMAPSVQTSRGRANVPESVPALPPQPEVPATLPLLDDRTAKLRSMIKELRTQMIDGSTDVGTAFAREARKIHDGVADTKPIHGVASRDEVRGLLEDGIEIMPIPALPDDAN